MKWKIYQFACITNIIGISALTVSLAIGVFDTQQVKAEGEPFVVAGMILGFMVIFTLLGLPSIAKSVMGNKFVRLLKENEIFNIRKLRSYYFYYTLQLILTGLLTWAILVIDLAWLNSDYFSYLDTYRIMFLIRYVSLWMVVTTSVYMLWMDISLIRKLKQKDASDQLFQTPDQQ